MTESQGASIQEGVEGQQVDHPASGKRLAVSAAAGQLLDESSDSASALGLVARAVLPVFADLCFLDLVDDEGRLRCADAAHILPAKEAIFGR
jgi:hypothetical protein